MQNGFIERFNRSYREAVLDMFVFQSLDEVRKQTEKWLREYNEERPHEALGHLTPREYLLTQTAEVSTYDWSQFGEGYIDTGLPLSTMNIKWRPGRHLSKNAGC